MKMQSIILLLNDVRSCYNVGSIFRTADAVGVSKIVCCGITPYPRTKNDSRPEKVIINNTKMIHKTALDSENSVKYEHMNEISTAIKKYKRLGYQVIALENKLENTKNIFEFKADKNNIVLIVGSETDGINKTILTLCDSTIEIPMHGIKNSLNVSVATGIALYSITES